MDKNNLRKRALDYVMARKCRDGGFCFYRLEEPNGLDTCCALSILDLLNVSFMDVKTVAWLKNMQHGDGSYDSVFSAYYALAGLRLLNAHPERDPWPYILRHIRQDRVNAATLPVEITSVFRRMAFLVDLFTMFNKDVDGSLKRRLQRLILKYRNKDGGFGYRQSTLGETSQALFMLSRLGYPVLTLQTDRFIRRCEHPVYGFTNIPETSLASLEYIYAGIMASFITDYTVQHPDCCIDFITYCQTRTGGFSRVTHGGIATLEDTFYAVHALKVLSAL